MTKQQDADLKLATRRVDLLTLATMMNSDATKEKKLQLLDEQQKSLEAELRLVELMRTNQDK